MLLLSWCRSYIRCALILADLATLRKNVSVAKLPRLFLITAFRHEDDVDADFVVLTTLKSVGLGRGIWWFWKNSHFWAICQPKQDLSQRGFRLHQLSTFSVHVDAHLVLLYLYSQLHSCHAAVLKVCLCRVLYCMRKIFQPCPFQAKIAWLYSYSKKLPSHFAFDLTDVCFTCTFALMPERL